MNEVKISENESRFETPKPHSDERGWLPLNDVELLQLRDRLDRQKKDYYLARLIGLYQMMRNVGDVKDQQDYIARQRINALLHTNHLNLPDATIVACQNIVDLRADIADYTFERDNFAMQIQIWKSDYHAALGERDAARMSRDTFERNAYHWRQAALTLAMLTLLVLSAYVGIALQHNEKPPASRPAVQEHVIDY